MSACNLTMWSYNYTQGMEVIFPMTVLNSLIKIANKAEAMFGNILREGTKLHSAL